MRMRPYFEVEGNRYEFKRTRFLVAEYKRLNEENPLSSEDKNNAVKATNLVADVRKFTDKADECWEKLCEDPTENNQRVYLMFKAMADKAIADYNAFVADNNTLNAATKHSINILEQVVIIALQEQYFNGNLAMSKQTWEKFVDNNDDHNTVGEWLMAFAECMFGENDEEEDNSFLAQKRKMDIERENNRVSALRKKR